MTLEQFLLKNDFPEKSLELFRDVLMEENGKKEALFEIGEAQYFRNSVVGIFEERLRLIFESESLNNVCLANHEEVLPDFRTSFTPNELLEYIFALLTDPEVRRSISGKEFVLSYPADPHSFWEKVEQGKKIKLQFK